MSKLTDFSILLTAYLSEYLPGQRNLSTNTIKSYRDTFSLFLLFCKNEKYIKIERLSLSRIDDKLITEFLMWLETARDCGISTRNQRLAALHTFFRYTQIEAPENIANAGRILGISFKRTDRPTVRYLTADALKLIFEQPNRNTASGRRDLTLLSVLYDTGARVQELIDLTVRDVRLEEPPVVTLKGKGNKTRCVPLMSKTAKLLSEYFSEHYLTSPERQGNPAFLNHQKKKLTRAGVTYILQKHTNMAALQSPAIFPEKVTPHILRHTKAMHLLQANVNLIYIRDLLGHSDVTTTEIYARADTEMKRKALENAYPQIVPEELPEWNKDDDLMTWLKGICGN